MLEKFLRARLPEQLVALIENVEQNPDTSHLEKLGAFVDFYKHDLSKFERWMFQRTLRKVRAVVCRDELLRKAMEVVINAPSDKGAGMYEINPHQQRLQRMYQQVPPSTLEHIGRPTWTDTSRLFK
jgi:hypothetical protein